MALWLHHLDSFGQTVTNQTALEFSLFAEFAVEFFFRNGLYLPGGLEHFFPFSWECHHPN